MKRKESEKAPLFIAGLVATFIHTFLVMGAISILFYDAYALAIEAGSIQAIVIAVLTVFLTNGLAEALLAALISATVVPPLVKLSKEK